MKLGLGLGIGGSGNRRRTRLYALNNTTGKQEPVYDVNGEPVYTKREA
jgi:hypothetical protein